MLPVVSLMVLCPPVVSPVLPHPEHQSCMAGGTSRFPALTLVQTGPAQNEVGQTWTQAQLGSSPHARCIPRLSSAIPQVPAGQEV